MHQKRGVRLLDSEENEQQSRAHTYLPLPIFNVILTDTVRLQCWEGNCLLEPIIHMLH